MLRSTASRLVRYNNVSLDQLQAAAGSVFSDGVEAASNAVEQKYPRVTEARIQGTTPHPSSKDKSETQNVVTVSYHTESGTRMCSIHVREDGTWAEFPSRAGRK